MPLTTSSSAPCSGTDRLPDPAPALGGFSLNPSRVEAQNFELVESTTTALFGLGGTNPAAANALGMGHYARVVTETAHLDGNLKVPFLYGFTPQAGQQFQIITVNTTNGPRSGLTGRFANLRKGRVAAVPGDLMLVLSEVNRDGNDVDKVPGSVSGREGGSRRAPGPAATPAPTASSQPTSTVLTMPRAAITSLS